MVVKVKDLLNKLEETERKRAKALEPKLDDFIERKIKILSEGENIFFKVGVNNFKNCRVGNYLRKLYRKNNQEIDIFLYEDVEEMGLQIRLKPKYH